MSTKLEAPNNQTPSPDADTEDEKKRVLDLSLTQVVGGALAAMTAAALGSTLGVGGTIAGAAFASVIAGVAGSVYTASLRTGRDKVVTVLRAPNQDPASAPPAAGSRAASAPAAFAPTTTREAVQETAVIPVWDPQPLERPRKRSGGAFPWRRAVAVSLAVFAMAAVLITGYERVSGQPLSGGTGTTVSQVRTDAGASDDNDTKPAPSESPNASDTPSGEPTTPEASETPAPSDEPSASESAESPSPSESTQTPTASPSAAGAGEAGGTATE